MKNSDNNEHETKFSYEFDAQTGILFKYYYGPIDLQTIVNSWNYAISNRIIPTEINGFILDYRKGSLQIDLNKFSTIPDYYKAHPEIFENKKIAIIVDKPRDIVVPMLVREKDSGYESKPFSTLEAAMQWILENR